MRYKDATVRIAWLVAALTFAVPTSAFSRSMTDFERLSENMRLGHCAEVKRIIDLSTSINFVTVMGEAIRLNSLCGWDEAVKFEPGPFGSAPISGFVSSLSLSSVRKDYSDWAERLFNVAADRDYLAEIIALRSGASNPQGADDLCHGSLEMLEVLKNKGVDINVAPRFWLKMNCQIDLWGSNTRVESGFAFDCYNSPTPNNHLLVPVSAESNGIQGQAISDSVQFNVKYTASRGTVFVDGRNNGVCTLTLPGPNYVVTGSKDLITPGGTYPPGLTVQVRTNSASNGGWQFIIAPGGNAKLSGNTTRRFVVFFRKS